MHLVAERFVFWGVIIGVFWKRVKTYLMTPMSPLDSPTFIFCLRIFNLWLRQQTQPVEVAGLQLPDSPRPRVDLAVLPVVDDERIFRRPRPRDGSDVFRRRSSPVDAELLHPDIYQQLAGPRRRHDGRRVLFQVAEREIIAQEEWALDKKQRDIYFTARIRNNKTFTKNL
jgi:hypothetical protein